MEELWLGKNKIRTLEVGPQSLRESIGADEQNLSTFSNLKILSIQSNRITKMEGLESLTALEDLYLSHNGITKIEGLENNASRQICRVDCADGRNGSRR